MANKTITYDSAWRNVQFQQVTVQASSALSAQTIYLPSTASAGGFNNFTIIVNDADKNALTHNITIDADGTDTINGAGTLVINVDGGAVCLTIVGDGQWLAVGNY